MPPALFKHENQLYTICQQTILGIKNFHSQFPQSTELRSKKLAALWIAPHAVIFGIMNLKSGLLVRQQCAFHKLCPFKCCARLRDK